MRAVATPTEIRRLLAGTIEHDVRLYLPQIQVPTLVMHRSDFILIPASHGRYLAEHIPNAEYREIPGGMIENVYTLKLLNKSARAYEFRLDASGLPGLEMQTDPNRPQLEPGAVGSIVAWVRVPRDAAAPGGHDLVFTATRLGEPPVESSRKGRFMLPPP